MRIDAAPVAINMMPAQRSLLLRKSIFIRKFRQAVGLSQLAQIFS
jgi:hypothetical protein